MRWAPLALAVACAHKLPDDQACLEVGYAIASRTADCEGDEALGVTRYEAFEAAYTCDIPSGATPEQTLGLYECALVMRNLACELAVDYGDDLDAWLSSSAACAALLEPT